MRGNGPEQRGDVARGFVTAAEVARYAGVSRSAVSRTFTPGASVSPAMRERILAAAGALGYRVNRVAQSLISARSSMVGLIGANLDTPFHAMQVSLLSAALQREGMQCLLLNATYLDTGLTPLLERLLELRVRAVVILSGSAPTRIVEECLRSGLRVVLINKPVPRLRADTIGSDDAHGARLAAQRLLAAGCRRLAVIGSGSGTPSITRRLRAFRASIAREGVALEVWATGPTSYETGLQAGRAMLPAGRIDGAFCVTDLLALGFMDAARSEFGLAIPGQLSVVGFDDIPQASWQAYRLTTIRQSLPQMVAAVTRALTREADRHRTRVILPVELVERGSVRATGSMEMQ